MELPINDGIKKYNEKKRISFHMPGHKGNINTDGLASFDVTELPDTDDLLCPGHYIKKSEYKLTKLFNTKYSFYLVGGSTCGIYTAISSCVDPGDKIIVDRGCHKSVINAIIIAGALPVYFMPSYSARLGFFGGVNAENLKNTIEKNKDAKAVFITSPTYYGITSNIKSIARIVHDNNMLLLADEAHGAHFSFSDTLPESSINLGADIVVQSVHKTLGSFSGGALLHVTTDNINIDKVRHYLSVYQTSSPSYAMLSLLEKAVFEAEKFNGKYSDMIAEIEKCADNVNNNSNAYWTDERLKKSCDIYDIDKTRIVINFSMTDITGNEAAVVLREKFSIECEMSDEKNIVCIATPYNKISDITKLAKAIVSIADTKSPPKEYLSASQPCRIIVKIPPRDAFYAEGEMISLSDAKGRICKKLIYKYPPGVPLICPGEEITNEHIIELTNLISSGENILGTNGYKIEVVKVSE